MRAVRLGVGEHGTGQKYRKKYVRGNRRPEVGHMQESRRSRRLHLHSKRVTVTVGDKQDTIDTRQRSQNNAPSSAGCGFIEPK